jgi:glycosyltransferase involved in cell wall biosynthesis
MDVELRRASIVAAPVIASSGTRLRILEAWAAGRPVVTTPHGAFGLDYSDGSDIFVCSSAQRFAEAAIGLLDDASLRAKVRADGLARAATYDWSVIGAKLMTGLEKFGILPASRSEELPVPDGS